VAALVISAWVCSRGGAGEEERETMEGMEVPGGGAPLTIWSSLEPDMLLVDRLRLSYSWHRPYARRCSNGRTVAIPG